MSIQKLLLPIISGLLLSFTAITPSPLPAAEKNTDKWIDETSQSLKTIEKQLKTETNDQQNKDQLKALGQIKGKSQTCTDVSSKALIKISANIEALGQHATGESQQVLEKRKALQKEQRLLDKRLNACNLVLIQSGDIIDKINKRHAEKLAQKLFNRDPDLVSVIKQNLQQPTGWWSPGLSHLAKNSGLERLGSQQLLIFFILLAVGLLGGLYLQRLLRKKLLQFITRTDARSDFPLALRSCLIRFSPILVPLIFGTGFLMLAGQLIKESFLFIAVSSAIGYLLILSVLRAVFFPCKPAEHFLGEPSALARKFFRRLFIAITIAWLSYLFFATGLDTVFSRHAYFLIRSTLLTLLAINLVVILWLARRFSWSIFPNSLRVIATIGIIIAVFSDFAGYKNFSLYLFGGITGSMFSLIVTIRLNRLVGDFFDQFDSGRAKWQKNMRNALGLKAGEKVPGLVWLRLLMFISFWVLFTVVVMRLWGWSQRGEAFVFEGLTQGFEIGSIRFIPSKLLLAILLFALVLSLSRLIKQNLAKRWIKHTNLDRGAQEAMVTISGYIGFILAIMIALSTAGVEFKSIAIVAGALSVGIGFGLQNIVNNFVSGLILLFERPIRRGDWIVVGQTEGYVKSINIRSTEIQTFDRADVIVPNSELISSQVTNWVLHDATGRVVLPIAVAYGTDTEKVKELLLQIANDHAEIIHDSSYISPPFVLFRSFGDSALEFELRCYIRNINQRLTVISDLNFTVDKSFREAGVEIPFPQRDLHIIKQKNPPE